MAFKVRSASCAPTTATSLAALSASSRRKTPVARRQHQRNNGVTVTATLGAPPPSTSHDADDHHHHLGNHGQHPTVLRAAGAGTAEPVTTEAFVHLKDTPATPFLEPVEKKNSDVAAAAEALEKRLESEAATFNFSGVNYTNANNDVNGYHQEYHVSQEELASVEAVEKEEATAAAEKAGKAAKAAAAAEEKLDLADATAAAEAKAFAEAQAAKRVVEAAVAAKAKKAMAKREAEAAVLSQMNEVPLMAASCCTEACVAVMVRFQWAAEWGGQEVFLAGTFSDWEELPVERSPSGHFVLALTLEPGHYSYKYKVDGKWRTSPMEPQVTDDHHNVNNRVTVAESVTYLWKKEWGGKEVFVCGTDSNWTERSKLEESQDGTELVLHKSMPVGTHEYKFIVDGEWRCSPLEPTRRDDKNCLNNVLTVAADASVTVYYRTAWEAPRLLVQHSSDENLVTEVPMGRASLGAWRSVSVPVDDAYLLDGMLNTGKSLDDGPQIDPRTASPLETITVNNTTAASVEPPKSKSKPVPALRFSIGNGEDKLDLHPSGGLYECAHPGGYKLESGVLRPFPRRAATMVVTDLDGTMVGDGQAFDEGTLAFKQYWEDVAGLAGGSLVWNTGRSIGQACSLFTEKEGLLAVPDVIITAVGTKIFDRDPMFPHTTPEGWRENVVWSRKLDEGWDLEAVRGLLEAQVEANPEAVHWLDRGTEHPHRCSLSVNVTALAEVRRAVRDGCKAQGVAVRIIVSGVGDWRYMDCVAAGAGKLEALEHVRRKEGVSVERCVACGDSGNDVLMLAGKNPAIVVGNAQPDLVEWVMRQPQRGRVVLADQVGAKGILEGLMALALW